VALSVRGLAQVCEKNVVELKFVRRNKMRIPSTRRMLCTLDSTLLNSTLGKEILNFKPPRFAPKYNAATRGLLVVWDIIMQDWRAVPADSCEIVVRIDTSTNNQKNFWDYYDKVLRKMTASQKKSFMDK